MYDSLTINTEDVNVRILSDKQNDAIDKLNKLDSSSDFYLDETNSAVKFIKGTLTKHQVKRLKLS